MRAKWGTRFLNISYGLFFVLYVFSAAAYGLTRDWAITGFAWGAGGTFFLWVFALILQKRWPRTGIWPWITSALILLYGWFVTVLAVIQEAVLDGRLQGWDDGFPATLLLYCSAYDAPLSVHAMIRTTALLGSMLVAVQMWRDPKAARALLLTIVFSAFGMVILFLLQRIFGGIFLFESQDKVTTLSFATYRYWGNAASYLNLFWPIAAGIALFAAIRQRSGWPLWIIPFAFIFVANFLNVSKAGNVLAGIGTLLFIFFSIPICRHEWRYSKRHFRLSYLLVALIPILVVGASLPFALPWKRWNFLAQTAETEVSGGRLHAYSSFLKILPDSSWVGFGPGSFQRYYLRYVDGDPKFTRASYWVAHQDYIQTAVEWGYVGFALWAFALIPPTILLVRASGAKMERPTRDFEGYRIGVFDHIKGFFGTLPSAQEPFIALGATIAVILTALHAFVDFPMQIASLQLYFLVLLALGWSYHQKKNTPVEDNDRQ